MLFRRYSDSQTPVNQVEEDHLTTREKITYGLVGSLIVLTVGGIISYNIIRGIYNAIGLPFSLSSQQETHEDKSKDLSALV